MALGTENNAPNISDTNASEVLGIVNIATGDYVDLGGGARGDEVAGRAAVPGKARPPPVDGGDYARWDADLLGGGGLSSALGIEGAVSLPYPWLGYASVAARNRSAV